VSPVLQEFVEFIAAGATPPEVMAFQPSNEAKARVSDLLSREKTVGLSKDETTELSLCLQIEHVMRLAKARALQRMQAS
jgi:hypothetical protein